MILNYSIFIKIKCLKFRNMRNIICVLFLAYFGTFTFGQGLIRDNSFGNSGIVNTDYLYNSGNAIYKIILLDDHKYIGFGSSKIIRFNENGTIDSSFGVNGEFQFPQQIQGGIYNIKLINNSFYFLGYSNTNTSNSNDGLLLRVSYDGILDTTFGNNGLVIYNINENEAFNSLAITSDNKIIAVGIKKTYPWQKLFLAKFNLNGTIDTTFQNNGYKEIYVFPMATEAIENISDIENDKFIIACTGKMNINYNYSQLALLKLDTDGNFDPTFNSTGTYIMPSYKPFYFNVKFIGNDLFVRNIDNLIYDVNYDAVLFKINLLDLSAQATVIDRDTFDYFIHPDKSVSTLSMNRDQINTYPNRNLFIKKYNSDGNLDTSFCNTGIYEFNLSDINNFQTDDLPGSIIIYDDKILVSGQSQIPQSGLFGFKSIFTRFNQITLSTASNSLENSIVFPNPAKDFININLKGTGYPAKISIYNLLGQTVFESNILDNEANYQIRTDNFESSLYTLKIMDSNNNVFVKKFLKQ